eukprot:TRINITY_DN984_c0_g1_i6.p1 TRINITY_DN984_c0_g1~~TRINITY_DN984_c0_g1_i6.p1  ORF type:complete len:474 (-),score=37.57 TRINITY_DN984_c0_g1_i6:396-1817(-)
MQIASAANSLCNWQYKEEHLSNIFSLSISSVVDLDWNFTCDILLAIRENGAYFVMKDGKRCWKHFQLSSNKISCGVFSSNSRFCAFGVNDEKSGFGHVKVDDLKAKRESKVIEGGSAINCIKFTEDDSNVVFSNPDSRVKIAGLENNSITEYFCANEVISSMDYKSSHILVGCQSGTISLFDIQRPDPIISLNNHHEGVSECNFHFASCHVLCSTGKEDGRFNLVDTRTKGVARCYQHDCPLLCESFICDTVMCLGTQNSEIVNYDIRAGRVLSVQKLEDGPILKLCGTANRKRRRAGKRKSRHRATIASDKNSPPLKSSNLPTQKLGKNQILKPDLSNKAESTNATERSDISRTVDVKEDIMLDKTLTLTMTKPPVPDTFAAEKSDRKEILKEYFDNSEAGNDRDQNLHQMIEGIKLDLFDAIQNIHIDLIKLLNKQTRDIEASLEASLNRRVFSNASTESKVCDKCQKVVS